MFGFIHGIVTIGGILMGDIIFILIAIGGLSFLAEVMGGFFVGIKYFGGAYLIFLGIKLCKSKSNNTITEKSINSSLLSSFLTGLSITLADQKAILFYLGFFPAFVNLSQISYLDIGIILTTAIIAVGGVKIIYALMADKIRLFFDDKTRKKINILAGGMMIFIGLFLFIKF
ncbi:Mll4618 protein [Geminocystis sp. NIES-3708]|nr:Mll4618 protein [Geminocystis sp. NIES-3708]